MVSKFIPCLKRHGVPGSKMLAWGSSKNCVEIGCRVFGGFRV